MMYSVKLHPKVKKFINKLDNNLNDRLTNRLKVLKVNDPFVYLEPYEGENCYKFRLGDYRALVDVDMNRKIIFVRVLDHRRRIYKRA